MRFLLWIGALFALLLFGSSPEGGERPGAATSPGLRPGELEIAVEWLAAPPPPKEGGRWRAGYRISNRGGTASGPLQLRVRTPLGTVEQRTLAADLAPGESLSGAVELTVVPGLSELCIDVRALDGERTLPEPDTSNNRVCRRVSRPDRARATVSATDVPEDTP